MNAITSLVKRYPQATFWVIAWSTFFFGYYMYLRSGSELWQLLILGTFAGGAIVTAIADGRSGLKTYFGRIVRWRVPIKWYAVAIFLPLLLRLGAFGLTLLSGAETVANPQWDWGAIAFETVLVFLIIALGEEPGFRGFALPRLLSNYSALIASLILGVLHAIWHLPLYLSGTEPALVILVVLSGAILNTWLFKNTGGSVLLNMIMHTSVNLWVSIFNPLFAGDGAGQQVIWLVVMYIASAVILVALTGPNLTSRQEAVLQPAGGV
jgi:membrane protease YdiL (CAAX protease family)